MARFSTELHHEFTLLNFRFAELVSIADNLAADFNQLENPFKISHTE
jgi:hypothetical protein